MLLGRMLKEVSKSIMIILVSLSFIPVTKLVPMVVLSLFLLQGISSENNLKNGKNSSQVQLRPGLVHKVRIQIRLGQLSEVPETMAYVLLVWYVAVKGVCNIVGAYILHPLLL